MKERISKHISYAEAIYSDIAKRKNILNQPNEDQLKRMRLLAEKVFEPTREHFGVSLFVSSFFRSKELNNELGGSKNSQHLADNGAAIDIDCDVYGGIKNKELFDYIRLNLEFDQLILEDVGSDGTGGWVHVSYKKVGNRNQVLVMTYVDGKKSYTNYS